jgi:hypothetical protein
VNVLYCSLISHNCTETSSAEMGVSVDHCEETGTSLVLALIGHVNVRLLGETKVTVATD